MARVKQASRTQIPPIPEPPEPATTRRGHLGHGTNSLYAQVLLADDEDSLAGSPDEVDDELR
jgi:hypothetical protein